MTTSAIDPHLLDVGADLLRLWLDDSLGDSCPLWQRGDSLATAQQRKLDDLAVRAGAPAHCPRRSASPIASISPTVTPSCAPGRR